MVGVLRVTLSDGWYHSIGALVSNVDIRPFSLRHGPLDRTISLDKKINVHHAEADRPVNPPTRSVEDDDEWLVSRVSAFRTVVGVDGPTASRAKVELSYTNQGPSS